MSGRDEGFEGGMTGSAGEGGFSAPGSGALDSSSASEPNMEGFIDPAELEGAIHGPVPIPESVIHVVGSAAEAVHAVESAGTAPFLVVPTSELEKLIGQGGDGA
jgi:hypothetical protein